LRILYAESYDDGRSILGTQRLIYQRQKQQSKNVMPFGVTNHSHMTLDQKWPAAAQDTEGHDSRPRQKKPKTEAQNLNDKQIERKARGRPRVSSIDETATDVSMCQMFISHICI
jgi:hypothetical protein